LIWNDPDKRNNGRGVTITSIAVAGLLCLPGAPAWYRPSVQRACKMGGILPGDIDGFIRELYGVLSDDHFRVRFQGEITLRWDDVKIRD